MKREELKNMLSQVEEQYIAEILDVEEMTSEAAPVPARPKRFAVWTAAAAVLCICTVGGGCLWWTQVHRQELPQQSAESGGEATAMQAGTVQRTTYELIWEEIPEERACIDYTLEAGGENTAVQKPVLPFVTADFTETRSGFYFDENGTAVNVYAWLSDDAKSIRLTMSDKGYLFPSNFFLDFSEDAGRECPVIHVYDMTQEGGVLGYELYCIYDGVGLSMETKGISATEAEKIAASFLTDGCTVQKLWEMNDYSQYFTLEQPVPVSADFTLETDGGVHELDETSPFFDLSPFGTTDFAGRFYLRENGSTANIRLEYRSDDGRSVTVTAGGSGKMYAHGQLAEDGGTERNSGRIYGSRTEDGGTALSFRVCDWDCEIIGDGMTEEEMILFYDRLSAYLWENFGDTVFLHAEECFSRDVSEITTQRLDLVWNGLHQYPITDPGIFTGLGLQSAEVHCTGDGTPQHALLYYSTGQTSIDIFMSSYGEMGPVFPISGESDGFRRNGIMMYGFSDAQNPDHRELCFVTANNIGVHLICYGVDAEEILALADRLIESGNSPAQLLDGN